MDPGSHTYSAASLAAITLPSALLTVYPPVISPAQLAELTDRTTDAVYRWTGTEKLRGACRRRGKRMLIWRDRALAIAAGWTIPSSAPGDIRLTAQEINHSFADDGVNKKFPLFMSVETTANLLGVGRSTLFNWKAFGYLSGTFVQHSDGIRFLRTRLLLHLFNGLNWRNI